MTGLVKRVRTALAKYFHVYVWVGLVYRWIFRDFMGSTDFVTHLILAHSAHFNDRAADWWRPA